MSVLEAMIWRAVEFSLPIIPVFLAAAFLYKLPVIWRYALDAPPRKGVPILLSFPFLILVAMALT